MIAYKVVGKDHRYGSNITAYINRMGKTTLFNDLRKRFDNTPLFTKYIKGDILISDNGFFCFKTVEDANNFISSMELRGVIIIKVKTFGRRLKDVKFTGGGFDLEHIRYLHRLITIPVERLSYTGTVVYSKVMALE